MSSVFTQKLESVFKDFDYAVVLKIDSENEVANLKARNLEISEKLEKNSIESAKFNTEMENFYMDMETLQSLNTDLQNKNVVLDL